MTSFPYMFYYFALFTRFMIYYLNILSLCLRCGKINLDIDHSKDLWLSPIESLFNIYNFQFGQLFLCHHYLHNSAMSTLLWHSLQTTVQFFFWNWNENSKHSIEWSISTPSGIFLQYRPHHVKRIGNGQPEEIDMK